MKPKDEKAFAEGVEERALRGIGATVEEAMFLDRILETEALCAMADRVRRKRCGGGVDTCAIVNARSGLCGEDCRWCSQSLHYPASKDCRQYEVVDTDECLTLARAAESRGVERFSLVTSGRKVGTAAMSRFEALYARIGCETPRLRLCASMGLLDREGMVRLAKAGVTRYHCNLETSARFFSSLCSTHTRADKLESIAAARSAGLEVCSGGIIGMDESMEDRLMLAQECRDAGAVSIPVNLLNPIPGTPLECTPLLGEEEIVRSAALMRLVAPDAVMRFAGGRARLRRETVLKMLRGGMNGVMVGDLLTTAGNDADDDSKLVEEAQNG